MKIALIVVASLAQAWPAFAAPVSGPVLGYAVKDGTARPIFGIPGSAYFGPPVDAGGRTWAAISAASDYALALDEHGTSLRLVHLAAPTEQLSFESSGSSPAGVVALSPRGSAAIIARQNGSVEVFAGLPHNPVLRHSFSVSVQPRLAAVEDSGESAVIADGQRITIVSSGGQRHVAGTDVRSIAFRPGGELIYLDGGRLISDSGASNSTLVEGLSEAAAALPDADSRAIYILHAAGKELLITGREDGPSQRIELPCSASGVDQPARTVLRLSCKAGGQVHLLDLSENPRLFFVPEPVQ